MFCDRCGTRLSEASRFCQSCGKVSGTMPLMPQKSRIEGHVRLLGILWLANAAIHLIPGTFLTLFFGHRWGLLPPDVPVYVSGLIHSVGVFLLLGTVASLLAGWGLLDRQPWARTLAIVLAVLNLLHVPFGTALGVYTLWVLLPAQSEVEYRRSARAA